MAYKAGVYFRGGEVENQGMDLSGRKDRMGAKCTMTETHCEQCGSTDYEDLHCGDQGYSACCNEIVTFPGDCRGHHLEG